MAGEITQEQAGFFALALLAWYLYKRQAQSVAANQPGAILQRGLLGTAENIIGNIGKTGTQSLGQLFSGGSSGAASLISPGQEAGAVQPQTGAQILASATGASPPVAGVNASTGDSTEEDARLNALNGGIQATPGTMSVQGLDATQIDLMNGTYDDYDYE